jgi:chromosome partitioning protein
VIQLIRLVISNQRGGVAKTTTAVILARSFANKGKKVLLIDTDSQGSIRTILGLKPEFHLADFLIRNMAFRECVVHACENVDVVCSNRDTTEAEVTLSNSPFRELTFERLFSEHEAAYDVILIDVAPSITLSQQCAMVYAQQVLVPVGMETLSLQGAVAAVNAAAALNRFFKKGLNVRTIGLLPVMVDRRLALTAMVLDSLKQLSADTGVPVLPVIRTDSAVPKAARVRKFLADFEPGSKALADYNDVASLLLKSIDPQAGSLDSEDERSEADEPAQAKSA